MLRSIHPGLGQQIGVGVIRESFASIGFSIFSEEHSTTRTTVRNFDQNSKVVRLLQRPLALGA